MALAERPGPEHQGKSETRVRPKPPSFEHRSVRRPDAHQSGRRIGRLCDIVGWQCDIFVMAHPWRMHSEFG